MGEVQLLRRAGQPASEPTRQAPRVLPEVRDRSFLPAALEVIETPPSPIRIAMMLTICALAAAGIAWACLAKVDIYATARGKIEPVGHVKVVQPLEAGAVREVRVQDGQVVAVGEVLLVLDAREAEAELSASSAAASAAMAEALRRGAEIEAVHAGRLMSQPIAWPETVPAATRLREEAVFAADMNQLVASLANLDDQTIEKRAAVTQLDASIEAESALLKPLAERVDLRRTLYDEHNNSRVSLIDAEQTLLETRAQLVTDVGRRAAAQAAIQTTLSERARTVEAFLADDEQKLADARKTLDEKEGDRTRSEAKVDHMTLRAPVTGRVQALTVTNPGQVLTAGQEVMRIVPSAQTLQVLAYVTNDDIGFVRPGQPATIKVDSFPFTRYGTIDADVVSVAYDALPADQANHAITDASKVEQHAKLEPSAVPVADLVFEAQIRPRIFTIAVGTANIPLSPGMTVTVETKTGTRTVISYLLASISETTSIAMHER